ncbi:MAG: hypothetical protein HYW63_02195 [Candidatus Levybacteria bacterium]|nr:hypothetical protein [Candidatus Levybacteria bacterium]
MENSKILSIEKIILPVAIVLFGVLLRLVPHPPNFAPIAAMALFGGAYISKRYALIVPLTALFLSDIVIGFHSTMPFVYISFILIGLVGLWLRKRRSLKWVLGATLFSSLLFFVITNFGVWTVGALYPLTLDGLIRCFYLALPFFRNTVVGDLIFVGLFFGSFELVLRLSQRFVYGRKNLYKNRR